MNQCSLHCYGVEINDPGYKRQDMPMKVRNKLRWTWKWPFITRVVYSGESVSHTKKDMKFGPFEHTHIVTGFGVIFEGFDKPVVVNQPESHLVTSGGYLTIKAGWEMHIT